MNTDMSKNNSEDFAEILSIIEKARENAFRAVNRELITMYWDIGKYVSERVHEGGWGKSVVNDFANFIQNQYIGIQGFSASNIWRMRQFYEIYHDNEKLAPLVQEISWTNNLIVADKDCRSAGILPDACSEKPLFQTGT